MSRFVECGRCFFCDEIAVLELDTEELADEVRHWMIHRYAPGTPLIQNAFPQLTAGEREMMLTGSHDACFNAGMESDDEDD